MQNIWMILLHLLMLVISSECHADAVDFLKYHVEHVPHKHELQVTINFNSQGTTCFIAPHLGGSLHALSNYIKDISIVIDQGDVSFDNGKLCIDSATKKLATVKYYITNPVSLTADNIYHTYIDSEMFFLSNALLLFPNKIWSSSKSNDITFNTSISFDIPKNHIICDSNAKRFERVSKVQWLKPEVYISGSNNLFAKLLVGANLMFRNISNNEQIILSNKVKKILDTQLELFGAPYASNSKLITLLIDNGAKHPNMTSSGMHHGKLTVNFANNEIFDNLTISHENLHNWINSDVVDSDDNNTNFLYQWFREGFVDYYAIKSIMPLNLLSNEQVISQYNGALARYALSSMTYKSYLEIATAKHPFQLFYDKGFLLASQLDTHIMLLTNNRSSLDDVMRKLIKKFQRGIKFTEKLLKSEIQIATNTDIDNIFNMIEYGKNFTPTSIPFGIKTKIIYIPMYIPRYGFDIGLSAITQKATNVARRSAEYKAGLRDGMFFSRNKNQQQCEPNPGPQTVTLIIGTDAGEKTITYTTESEKIMVPQYEIVCKSPETR